MVTNTNKSSDNPCREPTSQLTSNQSTQNVTQRDTRHITQPPVSDIYQKKPPSNTQAQQADTKLTLSDTDDTNTQSTPTSTRGQKLHYRNDQNRNKPNKNRIKNKSARPKPTSINTKHTFGTKALSLAMSLILALSAMVFDVPQNPFKPVEAMAWSSDFTNMDTSIPGTSSGNYPTIIGEMTRISFVDYTTGVNKYCFHIGSRDYPSIENILYYGANSKLDYLQSQNIFSKDMNPKYIQWDSFPTFIGAGTASLTRLKDMLAEDEFVNGLISKLNDSDAVDVLNNQASYKIIVEPMEVMQMTDGTWYAITCAELALWNLSGGGSWEDYSVPSYWASNGPTVVDQLSASAQVEQEHYFTQRPSLYPYPPNQTSYTPIGGPDAGNTIEYLGGKYKKWVDKTNYHMLPNNKTLLYMMGVAVISPDSNPVNYIMSHLEAEYLPDTQEVKFKALSKFDEGQGYNAPGFNQEFPYGGGTKAQLVTDKPAYTAGHTKSYVYIMTGSNYDANKGEGIYPNGQKEVPLYIENTYQYKTDGTPYPITMENYTGAPINGKTDAAGQPIIRSDGEWIYFKVPDDVLSKEDKIVIKAFVNQGAYRYNKDLGHSKPLINVHTTSKQNEQWKIEDQVIPVMEGNMIDNMLELEIPLSGSINLKAGGNSEGDPVKLDANYDYPNKNLCVYAPAIFLSGGGKVTTNMHYSIDQGGEVVITPATGGGGGGITPPPDDGTTPSEEGNPIGTQVKIRIRYAHDGKTTYFNGDSQDHKAGDIVQLNGKPLEVTRYIKDWKFDDKSVWTLPKTEDDATGVKMFGYSDYPVGNPTANNNYITSGNHESFDKALYNYCIPFEMPRETTSYLVEFVVNKVKGADDPVPEDDNPVPPESSYEDNVAVKPITIISGVNYRALEVTAQPTDYSIVPGSDGKPDYTKPYSIDLVAKGELATLVGFDEMSTDVQFFVIPEQRKGENPFTEFMDKPDGDGNVTSFEVPVNYNRNEALTVAKGNDVMDEAKKSNPQTYLTTVINKYIEHSGKISITADDDDFLVDPDDPKPKRIYYMFYVNPTNQNPGTEANKLPQETTYYDNVVTGSFLLAPPSSVPKEFEGDNYKDPALSCYIVSPVGGNYIIADHIPNSSTYDTANINTAQAKQPDTDYLNDRASNHAGGTFTVDMPLETPWGYKHYSYSNSDYFLEDEVNPINCGYCNGHWTSKRGTWPDEYWAQFKEGSGAMAQVVNKYLAYEGGKLVVKTQVRDLYRMKSHRIRHCDCEDCSCGDNGGKCTCSTSCYDFYRLHDTFPTTYTVVFDSVYTNQPNKTRVYSMQGRGTQYDYLLSAGYAISTVLRTRFITDYQPDYLSAENSTNGTNLATPFSMQGSMKFSMSSKQLNGTDLTNGGYPLETTKAVVYTDLQPADDQHDGITLDFIKVTEDTSEKVVRYYTSDGVKYRTPDAGREWATNTANGGNKQDNGWLSLYYFQLEPKMRKDSLGNNVRAVYTNKDYPDAVRVDNTTGQPLGAGKIPYPASPLEKATGYVGLKVLDIAWVNNRGINAKNVVVDGVAYKPVLGICYAGNLAIVGTMENNEWVRPSDMDETGN